MHIDGASRNLLQWIQAGKAPEEATDALEELGVPAPFSPRPRGPGDGEALQFAAYFAATR